MQAAVLDLQAELQAARGVTYRFISHDLAVVRAVADTVAIIDQGRLGEVGPGAQVFVPPSHPYTETLLAAVPVVEYGLNEAMNVDERAYVLLYRRLREMDVPEFMAPIIFRANGKPWDYCVDLTRQIWDEARHAMMVEAGLYFNGVAFYEFPIELEGSMSLNTELEPLHAHVVLWGVEQKLMRKDTGKRFEWIPVSALPTPPIHTITSCEATCPIIYCPPLQRAEVRSCV